MADGDGLSINVDDQGRIEHALYVLNNVKEEIPQRTLDELLKLCQGLASKAAARALSQPSFGPKHTGLFARVAAGVSAVPTDYGATVITTMEKENEAIIPRGMDTVASGGRGWGHPLFGKREHWYRNEPTSSWFLGAMNSATEEGEARLAAMLEQVAAEASA